MYSEQRRIVGNERPMYTSHILIHSFVSCHLVCNQILRLICISEYHVLLSLLILDRGWDMSMEVPFPSVASLLAFVHASVQRLRRQDGKMGRIESCENYFYAGMLLCTLGMDWIWCVWSILCFLFSFLHDIVRLISLERCLGEGIGSEIKAVSKLFHIELSFAFKDLLWFSLAGNKNLLSGTPKSLWHVVWILAYFVLGWIYLSA